MTNARRRPRRANDALGRVSAVGPARVGADVHGVIDSLDVPIVLVAPDSTIVSFNVAAATTLALTPTHRGAALRQLGLAGVEDLEELCEHVISGGAACQREVRDAGGSYFMLRIAPHTATDR